MDKKLQFKDYVFIGSLLFGLFFGAGNLIFPIQMGQLAGSDMWLATAGFIITAVGLPFLGIVAMGLARKESMYELASKISPGYGMFYTVALYLTIGPFFAIPRTATVSFEAAFAPYLDQGMLQIALVIFSALFFGFSLSNLTHLAFIPALSHLKLNCGTSKSFVTSKSMLNGTIYPFSPSLTPNSVVVLNGVTITAVLLVNASRTL